MQSPAWKIQRSHRYIEVDSKIIVMSYSKRLGRSRLWYDHYLHFTGSVVATLESTPLPTVRHVNYLILVPHHHGSCHELMNCFVAQDAFGFLHNAYFVIIPTMLQVLPVSPQKLISS